MTRAHNNRGWAFACLLVCVLPLLVGFEWEVAGIERAYDDAANDAIARRRIIDSLSEHDTSVIEHVILRALHDPDSDVRVEAAHVAGAHHMVSATAELLRWLDDNDPDMREAAIRALSKMDSREARSHFARALADTSASVREAAMEAIGASGDASAAGAVADKLDDAEINIRVAALSALAALGNRNSVAAVLGKLHDSAVPVRAAACRALGDLGDDRAVGALLEALRDDDDEVAISAAFALGRIGSELAVDDLAASLAQAPTRRMQAMIDSLSMIGNARALKALADALANPDASRYALAALSERRDITPATLDALVIHLAQIVDARVRTQTTNAAAGALSSLAHLGSIDKAARSLQRAVDDGFGNTTDLYRAWARAHDESLLLRLLADINPPTTPKAQTAIIALDEYFRWQGADGRAVEPVLLALSHAPPETAKGLIGLLARLRAPRAIEALSALLSNSNEEIRRAALAAAAELGRIDDARALLPLLDDANAETRFRAAMALSKSGTVAQLDPLLERLQRRTPEDREAVIWAIGGILRRAPNDADVTHAVERLQAFAESRDEALQARAVDALAQSSAPRALLSMRETLMRGTPSQRQIAAFALGNATDNESLEALRATLDSADPVVAAAALLALSRRISADEIRSRALEMTLHGRWPATVTAGAVLASSITSSHDLSSEMTAALCARVATRDPYSRANILLTLAKVGATCTGNASANASWLSVTHAPTVRLATARWLISTANDTNERALRRCAQADPSLDVRDACRGGAETADARDVELIAYAPNGEDKLPRKLVALRFSDGTNVIVYTDANAFVRIFGARTNAVVLDDPLLTPLESR